MFHLLDASTSADAAIRASKSLQGLTLPLDLSKLPGECVSPRGAGVFGSIHIIADGPALAAPSSDTAESALEEARSASGLPFELIWLAAVGIGFAPAFGPELIWMFGRWMDSEYYGHGVFIPLVSAYLTWRQRNTTAPGGLLRQAVHFTQERWKRVEKSKLDI